jgi:hypothetical protein
MTFYVSAEDTDSSPRQMYRRNRVGFNAKRIPRKAKKRLLREWLRWQWNPKAWR